MVVVTVVILESDIHYYASIEIGVGRRRFPMKADWVRMEDILILIEEGDVFRYTVFEDEGLGFVNAFINERNVDARVEKGEFP